MARATEITRYDDQSVDSNDENFHTVGDDPSWSESYYFYYFDPEREVGGYTRLGFRPHDGWRDAVHMLYLEGARIGFCYEREAHTREQREVAVGGSQLAMLEPFGAWRIDFDGATQDCPDGRVLVTPRKERAESWCTEGRARLALDYQGLGVPFYAARAGGGGHFEQFATAAGELQVGDRTWPFQGFGLRDKSWGPRPWTNQTGADDRNEARDSPFGQGAGWRVYGSWLTAVFHPGLAFAVGVSPTPGGGMRAQGYLMKDGLNHQLEEIEVETDYAGTTLFQDRCRFSARFEDGTTLSASGEVLNNGPSKIPHRSGSATIVNAAMTRFTLDTGERGLGITEYHSSVERPKRG
jgi:hypothetical protein